MILPVSLNNARIGGDGDGGGVGDIIIFEKFEGSVMSKEVLTGEVKGKVKGQQVTPPAISGSVRVVQKDGTISQVVSGNINC